MPILFAAALEEKLELKLSFWEKSFKLCVKVKAINNRYLEKGIYFSDFLIAGIDPGINVDLYRSSDRRCSTKKDGLENLVKFTGKHLC